MIVPIVTEIKINVAIGGKQQLVQYEQWGDYHFSMSRSYSGEWTEEEADFFQAEAMTKLRIAVEPFANEEYSTLLDAREALNS